MNNLKKYREKAKLSREDLAKKAGISSWTYLYRLEDGVSEPSIYLAYRLADALKKSVFTVFPKD